MNRPSDAACKSYAMFASSIGFRGERDSDAGAELDVLRVLCREEQREERIVTGLRGPDAAVAGLLRLLCGARGLAEIEPDSSVNLHGRGR